MKRKPQPEILSGVASGRARLMSTFSPNTTRLLSHLGIAQSLMIVFAVLTFDLIPIFLLGVSGVDEDIWGVVSRIFKSLWPFAAIPALGFSFAGVASDTPPEITRDRCTRESLLLP